MEWDHHSHTGSRHVQESQHLLFLVHFSLVPHNSCVTVGTGAMVISLLQGRTRSEQKLFSGHATHGLWGWGESTSCRAPRPRLLPH